MDPFEKISSLAVVKNFSYLGAIFVSLNPQSYTILGIFMIIDTITGVAKSGVVHGWRSITSHEASLGILSKMTLLLVPMLLAMTSHAVGMELNFVAKAALNILILSELYSILSNIQSIRMKKDVAEFDAISYALDKIRTGIENSIKKPTNKG
jgi:toxin secretion/phage lysis holin